MGGSIRAIITESVIASVFVLAASLGFRRNLWLVAAALLAQGLLDAVHGRVVANPGVPVWWPGFCLAYDIAAASYVAWTLRRSISRQRRTKAGRSPTTSTRGWKEYVAPRNPLSAGW